MKGIFIALLFAPFFLFAQSEMVPSNHVITNDELINILDSDFDSEIKTIQQKYQSGETEQALEMLAAYFKERFSERYLFDWKNFKNRFETYNRIYPGQEKNHFIEAQKHLELYPAKVAWKLPFENLKGETVTSYPYRHLTRQQKSGDIALLYYYTHDKKYLNYIPEQAASLNQAFDEGRVETIADGNGAYEAFRAGYRMFNWLFVHQCLLASEEYTWQQQIGLIKTFLHTGAQLYQHNSEFSWGNHQTRGMSALAMLSILFPEIKGSDKWQNLAFTRLEEHLQKEIYPDGFQFERSVHYHISDIRNYFYPFQLAKLNGVKLAPIWEQRINGLFETLVKIAFPDKSAPVLQDDTDSPWAEKNTIDETMALGATLFVNPVYKYFASDKISAEQFWWFRQSQLEKINQVSTKKPAIKSTILPETGYYIMREGWDKNDLYLLVDAGLTPQKPDHQHGNMLGVEAFAYKNVVLPNYQVRYYLPDLDVFKNSWVKNVLLVDSIPLGREWKGNKGGSGFGKYTKWPVPEVLGWTSNNDFDFFAGTHNGFSEVGVDYYRSVLFVKDGFWIVIDNLSARSGKHTAQQIWQGHYDVEKENQHARSVFPNGAGLEIVQLNNPADKITKASVRSKGRVVFEKQFDSEERMITLLYPFSNFEDRLYNYNQNDFKIKGWQFFKNSVKEDFQSNANQSIVKDKNAILFQVSEIKINKKEYLINGARADLWININSDKLNFTNIGINEITINDKQLQPGETVFF